MPTTVEALLIAMVFVMPGFLFVRTREWFVPPVAKSDAFSLTLTSITVSLAFVPLWLVAAPDLLDLRHRLTVAAAMSPPTAVSLSHRGVLFFALALLLPVASGFVAAIAYWQDWYPRLGSLLLPWVGIPGPNPGVGADVWEKLWLNSKRQRWLTIRTKDGPIYVGRGVEFGYSSQGRDIVLGDDTRVYDKEWNLVQNVRDSGGVGVWLPAIQIVSIEIYDPPAAS